MNEEVLNGHAYRKLSMTEVARDELARIRSVIAATPAEMIEENSPPLRRRCCGDDFRRRHRATRRH